MLKSLGTNKVAFLVVALVIAALATSGWLVYQHRTASSPVPKAPGYLDIIEWGIKVPLSASIKDAYYAPNVHGSYDSDGRPVQMLVGFKSLDSHGCAVAHNAAPVLLVRTSPSQVDPVSGEAVSQVYPGITIGSYFYGYALTKSATCEDVTTFRMLDAALKIAVKGIVPDTVHK